MINKKRLIKLTQELIRINSENPGRGESEIAYFVKNYLKKQGLEAEIYEFKKGRSNIVVDLKTENARHSLLITPHLDTVPAGSQWRFDPFAASIHAGKIYGRGATDDKGNLAAAIETICSIVEDGIKLDYDLCFAATADEESGSGLGLIPLIEQRILKPDAALILDASEFKIVIVQKGLMHLKVKLQGKKAHGAYPWRGENAIDTAMRIISKIKKSGLRYQRHPLLRQPTVNIGTIKGGDRVNIVADWCEFEIDLRYLPGMSKVKILKKIKGIIARETKKFRLEILAIQKPYSIDRRHKLVVSLIKTVQNSNAKPLISGSEGATVMTLFQDKKIPAVAFGFGSCAQAHNSDEYVKVANLIKGAKVLENFLKRYKF